MASWDKLVANDPEKRCGGVWPEWYFEDHFAAEDLAAQELACELIREHYNDDRLGKPN